MSLKLFKSPTIAAGSNAKTVKGDDLYQTAIMYLAPHTASGMGNVCPMAIMAGCSEPCLYKAGRAELFDSIPKARIAKTQRYFRSREKFMAELVRDLEKFVAHCGRQGVKPACRLNGTSDIQWEVAHPCFRGGVRYPSIFAAFPEVQFYDYTKIYKRVYRKLPDNYTLCLSYSAASAGYRDAVLKAAKETGCSIAVVYRTKALRDLIAADVKTDWVRMSLDRVVIDGDETDMRFLDPRGVIVGLYAKGKAGRADTSGFVVG